MNTSALILMITVEVIFTAITLYYFIKMLTKKPRTEPDSYTENDDQAR